MVKKSLKNAGIVLLIITCIFSMTIQFNIGVVAAVVVFTLSLVLTRPPANIVEVMVPGRAAGAGSDPADDDRILKTPTFYVYWVWAVIVIAPRSEERRVGKECRSRWSPYH